MDYYDGHGQNGALTCRYFGISRQTFYRWKRRYAPDRLTSLEARGRKPCRLRQPTWGRELARAVLHVREQHARWGKDKLAVLLRRAGWIVSTSMVGRVLSRLKARGIRLFVLRPRSPKLNGCVERAQSTHTEEFYEVMVSSTKGGRVPLMYRTSTWT